MKPSILCDISLEVFFLLIFYSSEIYVWAMGKITTLVIWAVIFLAGFLIGRFGGRSRSEKAVAKKRLSAVRLRISPCPNDTFMFEALLNGRIPTQGLAVEVGFQDIEELNEGVSSPDGPDISKISYAVLPAVVDRYALLDSGSALGRGNGQLLVRRRGDRSPIRRVANPGELPTANAMLLRVFA